MCIGYLGGWQLKYFWNMFTPKILGKMDPIWLAHIFQMGWRFNHHQGKLCWFLVFMGRRWDFFEMPSWNYGEKKGVRWLSTLKFSVLCGWLFFFFGVWIVGIFSWFLATWSWVHIAFYLFGAFCWSSVRFLGQKEQLTCMNGSCFVERWDDA